MGAKEQLDEIINNAEVLKTVERDELVLRILLTFLEKIGQLNEGERESILNFLHVFFESKVVIKPNFYQVG